ncbi:hypothetical protein BCY86_03405 [Pajaroellobacter abortibovis]|uniref:Uncharacterized protein n=1 Tax=Pajaroellobacter abortibovis TaxID=1882918 RepID=A0A1L6MWA2_9BACT|nr:hypothetical protein BCY86_03405 [Pajaroellobacter abortibovis]
MLLVFFEVIVRTISETEKPNFLEVIRFLKGLFSFFYFDVSSLIQGISRDLCTDAGNCYPLHFLFFCTLIRVLVGKSERVKFVLLPSYLSRANGVNNPIDVLGARAEVMSTCHFRFSYGTSHIERIFRQLLTPCFEYSSCCFVNGSINPSTSWQSLIGCIYDGIYSGWIELRLRDILLGNVYYLPPSDAKVFTNPPPELSNCLASKMIVSARASVFSIPVLFLGLVRSVSVIKEGKTNLILVKILFH